MPSLPPLWKPHGVQQNIGSRPGAVTQARAGLDVDLAIDLFRTAVKSSAVCGFIQ
jgi:hypothetical protein